jgi:hypothetical protein
LTFIFLADQSRGALRRGIGKHWLAAHSAARQAQVRAKDFFGYDLFVKKVIILCGSFQI